VYVDEVRIRSKSGLRSSKEKKKTFQGLASGTNYKHKRVLRAYYANFQGSLSCRNLVSADPAFFWVAISPLGHTQKEGKGLLQRIFGENVPQIRQISR
jgi:hypothetical protein